MGKLNDAKVALAAAIDTIPDLRVYNQPQDSINEFPAAIILTDPLDYQQVFKNRDFTGVFRVILLLDQKDQQQAFDEIDEFLDVTGPKSIRAAIQLDKTLGGAVDFVILQRAENINFREVRPGQYYKGADFLVEFYISDV